MTIRLLYIDDDDAFGRLIQKRLERHGYAVSLACDGDQGLARLHAGSVDVVALDHHMPGEDGLAILARIMRSDDPPPVIYVTATNESGIAVAALKAGAADYVVKDIRGDLVDLLDVAFRAAVEGAKLRRERDAASRAVTEARDRFEALAIERQTLLREVNHRVGNSLQLVAAFLHLQSAGADQDTRTALNEANRRVLAIAQVHRRLYASDDVQSVALAPYLKGLVEDIRASSDGDTVGADLSLSADPVEVDPDTAVAIGVIVTELVINALKYAYPGGSGPIRILFRIDEGDNLLLSVEDDGQGLDATTANPGTGIGKTIIDSMAQKLDARVTYEGGNPGTRAIVTFRRPTAAGRPGL